MGTATGIKEPAETLKNDDGAVECIRRHQPAGCGPLPVPPFSKTPYFRTPASDVQEYRSRPSSTSTELSEIISAEPPKMSAVYSMPLDALRNKTVDLTPYLSDEHFRFVDADAFIHQRALVIHETSSLPDLYTVISYVWFGLVAEPSQLEEEGSFRVFCGVRSDGTPREDGGPISLKVLEYACQWASNSSSSYLWLDRLCILQTSKQDKGWQISRMYDIYDRSEQCIVLPGGLQRLASVFDETTWADRAWTYQEAIVTWDYAIVLTRDWHRPKGEQHWLVDGECHWQYLMQLFIEGDDLLTRRTTVAAVEEQPCLILGRNGEALNMLRRIMEYKSYNHLVDEGEETISNQTIHQLVLQGVSMRTSSRPVDMVLSILGLLDIQDTFQDRVFVGEFGENERFRATLTLVEAVLCLEDDDEDDNASDTSGTLVDIPLWYSLELVDDACSAQKHDKLHTTSMPTLHELAQLLDNDTAKLQLSSFPEVSMKRVPLADWTFAVEQLKDDPHKRASTIALAIPDSDLLRVHHGEVSRVLVHHKEEGVIELCRKLELVELPSENDFNPVVFGWTLKLDKHPYIRFYKFDISNLFL